MSEQREVTPLDISKLKPGQIVFAEVDIGTWEPGEEMDDTALVVIEYSGVLYTMSVRNPYCEGMPVHEMARFSAFRADGNGGSRLLYATQADAIRAGAAFERECAEESEARAAAAFALADEMDRVGRVPG